MSTLSRMQISNSYGKCKQRCERGWGKCPDQRWQSLFSPRGARALQCWESAGSSSSRMNRTVRLCLLGGAGFGPGVQDCSGSCRSWSQLLATGKSPNPSWSGAACGCPCPLRANRTHWHPARELTLARLAGEMSTKWVRFNCWASGLGGAGCVLGSRHAPCELGS